MLDRSLRQTTTGTTAILGLGNSAATRFLAQSLTMAFATKLTALKVALNRAGTLQTTDRMYIEVYSGETPGSGTLLGTSQSVPVSTTATGSTNWEFIFRTPIDVPSGLIWIKFIGTWTTSAVNFIYLRGSTPSAYANGKAYYSDGSTYTEYDGDVNIIVAGAGIAWYLDQSATGLADGTSPENAWTTLDQAFAEAGYLFGDVVLWRGSYLQPALISSMTQPSVAREFIGVNSSWVEDGTQPVIDCNGFANMYGFTAGTPRTHVFRNLNFKNWATGLLLSNAFTGYVRFEKCKIESGATVYAVGGGTVGLFAFNCEFKNLTGIASGAAMSTVLLVNCHIHNVTTVLAPVNIVMDKCLIYDCANGIYGSNVTITDCIFDTISLTAAARAYTSLFARGCKFTNNAYMGIFADAGIGLYVNNCKFSNNTINIYRSVGSFIDEFQNIYDSVDGYTDRVNKDFTPLPSAVARRTALAIPNTVGTHYYTSGLQGTDVIWPRIEQTIPSCGSTDGAQLVLYGLGLSGTTSLRFINASGTITSGSITSSANGLISGAAPTLTAGRYDIVASGVNGVASISGGWTAQSLDRTITSITKSIGDVDGYMVVRLYSAEGLFLNASGVSFEGTPAVSFTVIDAYNIDAVVPRISPEFYTIEVS